MRARTRRGFEHAGAQALAAHLHQAEARDAADLDARAVVLQRILHRALHLADVRAMIHVDEVDHDEPGHVAQAELAGDFGRGLKIGAERSEERRVGKECVSMCKYGWWTDNQTKKET